MAKSITIITIHSKNVLVIFPLISFIKINISFLFLFLQLWKNSSIAVEKLFYSCGKVFLYIWKKENILYIN